MPTELGEVVPSLPTLVVPEMDEKLAPATSWRWRYSGGADFNRRNRLNGEMGPVVWLAQGDGSFHRFFTPEEVAVKLSGHRPLLEPLLDYLGGERGRFYAYTGWSQPGTRV
jgi:hypothetical protein